MTPEQPTDPEVQRILALKRHEQPPPAFFRGLSEQIIDRIQAGVPRGDDGMDGVLELAAAPHAR